MAELILLTADRAEIVRLHRAAQSGDAGAIAAMAQLWDEYRGRTRCAFCAIMTSPGFRRSHRSSAMAPTLRRRSRHRSVMLPVTCRKRSAGTAA
jgi:hypothetical protein